MPAPIAVAIAATVARALATQAAKQGVKQLTKNEARIVARKAVRQIAAKSRSQSDKSRAVSGKQLDSLINKANLSARSTKPVRNAQGLRTTTGQGKSKITKGDVYQAVKDMSKSPSGGSGNISGVGTVRRVQAKPYVRVTTRTSGGPERPLIGPKKKVDVQLTKRTEGPSRRVTEKKTVQKGRVIRDVKITKFEKSPSVTKRVSGEKMNSQPQEKVTVKKPLKKTNPKEKGSAITIRKTQPRKPADVKAAAEKAKRDRLREALTPRVNPARPKVAPKRGIDGSSKSSAREQEIIDRYYRIRFGDKGGPTPRSAQGKQSSIESRIASGSEKPTRGPSNSSNFDSEAETLLNRSIRAIENPKASARERVKPGKPTRTTSLIKSKAKPSEIKGAIRNQRRVLREREIKETAERMRKAEEAAKKRGTK